MSNEDKTKTLSWFEQGESRVIFCTTALALGYDYTKIKKVVVVGSLHSWSNVMQAFGRAGRNGSKCTGILALTESDTNEGYYKGMSLQYECFRKLACEQDGEGITMTCKVLEGVELCWYCQGSKREREASGEIYIKEEEVKKPKISKPPLSTVGNSMEVEFTQQQTPRQELTPPQDLTLPLDVKLPYEVTVRPKPLIVDPATKARITYEVGALQILTKIRNLALDIAQICVFCYFEKNRSEKHARCRVKDGVCLRCLGDHSLADCNNQIHKVAPNDCCFVCYLPLSVHTKLGESEAGYGRNCKWVKSVMSDNLKYWFLLIARTPQSVMTMDILRLDTEEGKDIDFEHRLQKLKRIFSSNSLSVLEIIGDKLGIGKE